MSLASKFYTARHIFLKSPEFFSRIRLYREFRRFSRQWNATEDFALKVRDVCAAPDNERIPRVSKAGQIENGFLIMHNGVRIIPDSYVGEGMTQVLQANRGVHEPQEEVAFAYVLNRIRQEVATHHVMIELGSYWAFYSLWFASEIACARCFCIEPEAENFEFGKRNFAANGYAADFIQAFVGAAPNSDLVPTISIDSFVRDRKIQKIDLLHADIQGAELEMLQGATETLAKEMIDYVFISSHHNFLHYRSIDLLRAAGFEILAEVDLLETYSTDGVIVAGRRGLPKLEKIAITPRRI